MSETIFNLYIKRSDPNDKKTSYSIASAEGIKSMGEKLSNWTKITDDKGNKNEKELPNIITGDKLADIIIYGQQGEYYELPQNLFSNATKGIESITFIGQPNICKFGSYCFTNFIGEKFEYINDAIAGEVIFETKAIWTDNSADTYAVLPMSITIQVPNAALTLGEQLIGGRWLLINQLTISATTLKVEKIEGKGAIQVSSLAPYAYQLNITIAGTKGENWGLLQVYNDNTSTIKTVKITTNWPSIINTNYNVFEFVTIDGFDTSYGQIELIIDSENNELAPVDFGISCRNLSRIGIDIHNNQKKLKIQTTPAYGLKQPVTFCLHRKGSAVEATNSSFYSEYWSNYVTTGCNVLCDYEVNIMGEYSIPLADGSGAISTYSLVPLYVTKNDYTPYRFCRYQNDLYQIIDGKTQTNNTIVIEEDQEIPPGMFFGTKITTLTINGLANQPKAIPEHAFYSCGDLTDITFNCVFEDLNVQYGDRAFRGEHPHFSNPTDETKKINLTFKEKVKVIEADYFANLRIDTIKLNEASALEVIEDCAFYNCTVNTITGNPSELKIIGGYLFGKYENDKLIKNLNVNNIKCLGEKNSYIYLNLNKDKDEVHWILDIKNGVQGSALSNNMQNDSNLVGIATCAGKGKFIYLDKNDNELTLEFPSTLKYICDQAFYLTRCSFNISERDAIIHFRLPNDLILLGQLSLWPIPYHAQIKYTLKISKELKFIYFNSLFKKEIYEDIKTRKGTKRTQIFLKSALDSQGKKEFSTNSGLLVQYIKAHQNFNIQTQEEFQKMLTIDPYTGLYSSKDEGFGWELYFEDNNNSIEALYLGNDREEFIEHFEENNNAKVKDYEKEFLVNSFNHYGNYIDTGSLELPTGSLAGIKNIASYFIDLSKVKLCNYCLGPFCSMSDLIQYFDYIDSKKTTSFICIGNEDKKSAQELISPIIYQNQMSYFMSKPQHMIHSSGYRFDNIRLPYHALQYWFNIQASNRTDNENTIPLFDCLFEGNKIYSIYKSQNIVSKLNITYSIIPENPQVLYLPHLELNFTDILDHNKQYTLNNDKYPSPFVYSGFNHYTPHSTLDYCKKIVILDWGKLPEKCFSNLHKVEEIYLLQTHDEIKANNKSNIGKEAFSNNKHLLLLKIMGKITSVGSLAFYQCFELEKVYSTLSADEWYTIDFKESDQSTPFHATKKEEASYYFNGNEDTPWHGIVNVYTTDSDGGYKSRPFLGYTIQGLRIYCPLKFNIREKTQRHGNNDQSILAKGMKYLIYMPFDGWDDNYEIKTLEDNTSLKAIILGEGITDLYSSTFTRVFAKDKMQNLIVSLPSSIIRLHKDSLNNCYQKLITLPSDNYSDKNIDFIDEQLLLPKLDDTSLNCKFEKLRYSDNCGLPIDSEYNIQKWWGGSSKNKVYYFFNNDLFNFLVCMTNVYKGEDCLSKDGKIYKIRVINKGCIDNDPDNVQFKIDEEETIKSCLMSLQLPWLGPCSDPNYYCEDGEAYNLLSLFKYKEYEIYIGDLVLGPGTNSYFDPERLENGIKLTITSPAFKGVKLKRVKTKEIVGGKPVLTSWRHGKLTLQLSKIYDTIANRNHYASSDEEKSSLFDLEIAMASIPKNLLTENQSSSDDKWTTEIDNLILSPVATPPIDKNDGKNIYIIGENSLSAEKINNIVFNLFNNPENGERLEIGANAFSKKLINNYIYFNQPLEQWYSKIDFKNAYANPMQYCLKLFASDEIKEISYTISDDEWEYNKDINIETDNLSKYSTIKVTDEENNSLMECLTIFPDATNQNIIIKINKLKATKKLETIKVSYNSYSYRRNLCPSLYKDEENDQYLCILNNYSLEGNKQINSIDLYGKLPTDYEVNIINMDGTDPILVSTGNKALIEVFSGDSATDPVLNSYLSYNRTESTLLNKIYEGEEEVQ